MKSKGAIISRYCVLVVVSLLLFLCSVCFADDEGAINNVTMTMDNFRTMAETDDNFVCGTLEWWPATKCENGTSQCPWGNAGVLDLNLSNPILVNAVKAFDGGIRIRIGGLLQNQVHYKVGTFDHGINCSGFEPQPDGMFGFSTGCLDMDRWDSLNKFFKQTGAVITFGLNALNGKTNTSTRMEGDWNPTNAYEFMKYTAEKQYQIDSYELGTGLLGSSGQQTGATVDPKQYANDMMALKNITDMVYLQPKSSGRRPNLVGPGGAFEEQWFDAFLDYAKNTSGGAPDSVTHNFYNLGSGIDKTSVLANIMNPEVVDNAATSYFNIARDVKLHNLRAWVSESGGTTKSGSQEISNSFANMFWYANQLGLASMYNHTIFCRETLVGGYYGLLNATTFTPNPDYYCALLFNQLMGKKVLFASHDPISRYLRVYAHCSKKNNRDLSILIINMSNSTSFNVRVPPTDLSSIREKIRDEYHLTPEDGNILSKTVLLNDMPLNLTNTHDIPKLIPSFVNATTPIEVAPYSIVFVSIADYNAHACA